MKNHLKILLGEFYRLFVMKLQKHIQAKYKRLKVHGILCCSCQKKDGSLRLCMNWRKLNSRTKKDAFPWIYDTLHALSGENYFSKVDLKLGYWQVEVDAADKEKTAFHIVGVGLFNVTEYRLNYAIHLQHFKGIWSTILKIWSCNVV